MIIKFAAYPSCSVLLNSLPIQVSKKAIPRYAQNTKDVSAVHNAARHLLRVAEHLMY